MNSIDMPSRVCVSSTGLRSAPAGHVERGGRLVGDQQVGLVGKRDGDHDALALPPESWCDSSPAGRLDRECDLVSKSTFGPSPLFCSP